MSWLAEENPFDKPTFYNGNSYEFREHAQWAKFFDLAGVKDWRYYPYIWMNYVSLDGLPHFYIGGDCEDPIPKAVIFILPRSGMVVDHFNRGVAEYVKAYPHHFTMKLIGSPEYAVANQIRDVVKLCGKNADTAAKLAKQTGRLHALKTEKPAPIEKPTNGKKRYGLPQGLRFDVFRRDNFTCVYCGGQSPQVVLECDHVTPVSKGGSDTMDNLVTACSDCNRGKSAKDVGPINFQPNNADPVAAVGADPLKGLYGHSIVDGEIIWQFYIRGAVGDSHSVQMFSWLDGRPTNVQFIKTVDLTGPGYKLYSSEQEWLRVGDTFTSGRGQ